jgi:hypothetical protein
MRGDRGHVVSQVAESVALEACGMGGKDGGREDRGLDPRCGKYRESDCQRALTDARYILNSQYSFGFCHGFASGSREKGNSLYLVYYNKTEGILCQQKRALFKKCLHGRRGARFFSRGGLE